MLLYITHTTTYHYAPQVNMAQHMAHLLPHSSAAQTVSEAELHISPEPASRNDAVDVYGNVRSFFSLPVAHDTLRITAQSTVDTHFMDYPPEQALATPPGKKCVNIFCTTQARPGTRPPSLCLPRPMCSTTPTLPTTPAPASHPTALCWWRLAI